jgi:hypothetical protein
MFGISNRIRRRQRLKLQASSVVPVVPAAPAASVIPGVPVDPPFNYPIPKSKRQPSAKPKLTRSSLANSSAINVPLIPKNLALVQARNRLELALAHSHAPKTSKNYGYAVRRYVQFAASIGFSEDDAFPASEELILLWICEGLGKTGPGTAKQNLAALRAWHLKHRLPWHRPECVPFISKALREFWPRESRKPAMRPPITSAMISMLITAWQGGSPKELCALAIAIAAWCGQCRLGELLPESLRSLDRKRIPRRSHWNGPSPSDPDSSVLTLPWTKTKLFDGDQIFLLRQRHPLNATTALSRHFIASPLSPDHFLCQFGTVQTASFLCKESFMEMCNVIWSKEGLPRITGHSFRIGGTTALLCSGVNPDVVKKLGRWSSDAFLTYWRSLGHLFSKHASDLVWND